MSGLKIYVRRYERFRIHKICILKIVTNQEQVYNHEKKKNHVCEICIKSGSHMMYLTLAFIFPPESVSQAGLIEICIFLFLLMRTSIRVSFMPSVIDASKCKKSKMQKCKMQKSWIGACKMQKKQNTKMQNAKKLDWRLQRSSSFPALPLSNSDPPNVLQHILNCGRVFYKSFVLFFALVYVEDLGLIIACCRGRRFIKLNHSQMALFPKLCSSSSYSSLSWYNRLKHIEQNLDFAWLRVSFKTY